MLVVVMILMFTFFVPGCTVHSASGPGRSWGNLAGGVFFDASLVKGEGQSFAALGDNNVQAFSQRNPLDTFNSTWGSVEGKRAGAARSVNYSYTQTPIAEEASRLIHKE